MIKYTRDMKYFLIGLGNPGEEYTHTPHNIGRDIVRVYIEKKNKKVIWKEHGPSKSTMASVAVGDHTIVAILPNTYMNNSGKSAKELIVGEKNIERTIVIHDDLDLGIGAIKISFDRGSGGHKGVESITRALKTSKYVRMRVGVSPTTPKGKVKKIQGGDTIVEFILKPLKKKDQGVIDAETKIIFDAIDTIINDGKDIAMTRFN